MKYPQKKIFVWLFILAIVFGVCVSFSASGTKAIKHTTVIFKNTTVSAEVMETVAEQRRGLSGRKKMAEKSGMWFSFPDGERSGFWMKEMNFSIDMIWFDTNLRVIYVKENATPESYPEVFGPRVPYRYVLEVPAGFVQKNSVALGDVVSLRGEK